MNKVKVTLGQTVTNKPYNSNRYDIELESETTEETITAAQKLFAEARQILESQKKVDSNGNQKL